MLEEIMQEILAAEEQADAILADAAKRAKEISLEAETSRARIVTDGKKKAAELLASLEKETEAEAQAQETAILEKGKTEAAAVGKLASGRVTEAAEAVRDRVLKKYGVTAL